MTEQPSLQEIVQQLEQTPAEKFNYFYERYKDNNSKNKFTNEKLEFTTSFPNKWYVQISRGFAHTGDYCQQDCAVLLTVPATESQSSRRYIFDNLNYGDAIIKIYENIFTKVTSAMTDEYEKTLFATFQKRNTTKKIM